MLGEITRKEFLKISALAGLGLILQPQQILALKDKKTALIVQGLAKEEDYLTGIEKEIPSLAKFEVINERVYSSSDFIKLIADVGKKRKIDFLFPSMHGSQTAIFFPDDSYISTQDIKEGLLDGFDKYFNKHTGNSCYFHSCNVAELQEDSFAENFFKKLRINGEAPTKAVGLVPLLDDNLRVPAKLTGSYDVLVSGPNMAGISYCDVIFRGIPITLQSYKGEIPNEHSFGFSTPIGAPKEISNQFFTAWKNGEVKIPKIENWSHYEKREIHPWRYFKNSK